MSLTLSDIMPVGLCIATQELFDAKRFRNNFCDFLLFRAKDMKFTSTVIETKRQLNSSSMESKFLEGHKTAIISNIDKIISLVSSRYANIDARGVERIVERAKNMINRVLTAENFDQITVLEPEFRNGVTLPVYELFSAYSKRMV
jgi:hypothetical protein